MKTNLGIFVAVSLSCLMAGCGSSEQASSMTGMSREAKYQRLAIVCAPAPEADPQYASIILGEAQRNVQTRLGFLKKVDCVFDAPVDTTSTPPTVKLSNSNDYDAIVCLVYSYGGGSVRLDFHMLDTNTNQEVWTHQFNKKEPDIRRGLIAHGWWTPSAIKNVFYDRQ
jgi:hypothetical protein